MLCIALTGTIASGKSTVSQLFRKHGAVVISADDASRQLTTAGQPALKAIVGHFGSSLLKSSGELNRPALRELIFQQPKERIWLEQLLHPLIRKWIKTQLAAAKGPYTLIEIPLLNKREDYPYLDRVLLVLAKQEQQIERVMQRDQCSRTQAEEILAVQASEDLLRNLADDILYNDKSLAELEEKIEILHGQYLQLAGQKS